MSFRIEEVDSVRAVAPEEWARVEGDSLHLARPWLLSLEKHPDFTRHHLLARDGTGRLAGALPSYLYRRTDLYPPYNPFFQFIDRPAGSAPPEPWFPLLLGGTRSGYRNQVLVDPTLQPAERAELVRVLLDGLLGVAARQGASSVAFMYLTPEAAAELRPLVAPGAELLLSMPDTRLDLQPFANFEAYLASLSNNTRGVVKRDLKRLDEERCTITNHRLSECLEEVAPLMGKVQEHHGARASALRARDYLRDLVTELDETTLIYLCRREGQPIAFSLFLEWQQVLYGRVIGLDYEAVGKSNAYFNVAYHLPVRDALARRLRAIEFGPGTYEVKLRRGARPEPRWSIVCGPRALGDSWRTGLAGWNEREYSRLNEEFSPIVGPLPPDRWRR